MDGVNNAAKKPTNTNPNPGPSPPPTGRVTRGERIAQDVKKLPTAKDAASAFESLTNHQQKEVLWKLFD